MSQIFSTRAGRAFRRENSDFVDSDPAKGILSLELAEDELLHLRWRGRDGSISSTEDTDLVIFPTDASLQKASSDPTVRMYVLKFQSSDQLHFFWFQDPNVDRDADDAAKINELLIETDFQLSSAEENPSEDATMADTTLTNPPQTTYAGPLDQTELNAFVQELVRGLQRGGDRAGVAPDLALSDVLTPSVLALVLQDSEAANSLAPFLPPDLFSPSSPVAHLSRQEILRQIVASAPFRASVRSLDQALSTGLLGGLVTNLGMPAEAGLGVHPFLEAVQVQASRTDQAGETEEGEAKRV